MTDEARARAPEDSIAALHDRVCAAVREAGERVRDIFARGDVEAWHKDDRSPVSEADLEANTILRENLLARPFDRYGWLSEEEPARPPHEGCRRTFVIDPLDGTRAFLARDHDFTICAAVIENGHALSAAVFSPMTDEFFEAVRGGGARRNGAIIRVDKETAPETCRLLAARRTPRGTEHLDAVLPRHGRTYKSSTAYRLCLVGAGTYDATVALVAKADWDVAPGALIATEAGALAGDHLGRPFRFGPPEFRQRSLVCANPLLYRHLVSRMAAARDEACARAGGDPTAKDFP